MKKQNKNHIVSRIFRQAEITKIDEKISLLGDRARFNAIEFLNFRLLFTIVCFVATLSLTNPGYIYAPIIALVVHYGVYYLLITLPIKKRSEQLDREALQFFEILTLTLESGRNLESSLEVTVFNVHSELSNEFKRALMEIKFGRSLMEALESMKLRIPSETVNNIILNITQTNMFGNRILDTMYNQIDFLRDKQILEIKGQINKIPNKISIISVVFIVPLILLLILGPLVINFLTGGII